MARFRGPKTRTSRKFGEPIYGYDRYFDKKPHPPGQQGNSRRRRQPSEYGIQLKEKQKAKHIYGLLERQFLNTFKKAARKTGITGDNLLQMLESRLDNTVFRMGLAKSRRGARQLVSHKHITVNGRVLNIPSSQLRPGDVVAVREKSKSLESIEDSLSKHAVTYSWLEWNGAQMSGVYLQHPEREAIPENIKEQLIIELYSK